MKREIGFLGMMVLLLTTFSTSAANLDRVLSLRGYWKFTIGDDMKYANQSYDDSNWEDIYAPAHWEEEGFHGYDGYAWYRKHFDGSSIEGLKNVVLNLGYIDDVDYVYVNGNFVGYSGNFPPNFHTAWTALREYNIPIEYLNPDGDNVIAVRVYDTTQGGGIISGSIGLYTRPHTEGFASLEGLWKFKMGDRQEWRETDFDDTDWPYIMVPSLWQESKWRRREEYGWYRREFEIPADMEGEQLNIILGKIDDFDQVYINGTLIGETNDGRSFGRSDSYNQYRNYPIPDRLLKPGKNIIAVQVLDIGNNAGIYKGPVGLAIRERSNLVLWRY
ncbi:MAG: beta galactosidase jelly roll domain-containing protein [Bacteroidota bacterium]